jgi:hypothetical protein
MKHMQWIRRAVFLLCILAAGNAVSQDAEEPAPVQLPDLNSLHSTGWGYFDVPHAEAAARSEAFFAAIEEQLVDLSPQNEELANSLLRAVRDNISAYIALLEDPDISTKDLDTAHMSYGIDQLLQTQETLRRAP